MSIDAFDVHWTGNYCQRQCFNIQAENPELIIRIIFQPENYTRLNELKFMGFDSYMHRY